MKNLLKRVFIVFILFIAIFFNNTHYAECAELYNIKAINFDMSNSLLFVPVKQINTTTPTNITTALKATPISENTVEIEISSAKMDAQPDNFVFSDGNLKEFYITQSNDKVIIKLVFKTGYNLSNLKIGNVNNNIIINYSPLQPFNMNYYINTYKDTQTAKDYKETLSVITKTISKQELPVSNTTTNDKSMNEINQAFANATYNPQEVYTEYKNEDLALNNRLKSKYYLFDAKVMDNTFKIVGLGAVNIVKPFMLDNPKRIIFDIPNSTINPDLHGKELTLSNGDVIKMAQFNPTTTRLVVTSEDASQYIPVYYPDSQGIIVANPRNLLTTHMPDYKSNIIKFNYQKVNNQNNFFFEFDKPIIYAIKRTPENLFIYFLNAEKYNDNNYRSTIKNTSFSDMTIHLLSTGMRIKLPTANKEGVNTYISPDGKLFKLAFEPKIIPQENKQEKIKALTKKEGSITASPKYTEQKNKNIIVIDAGHGGKDCGALRGNIYEKTITLDVSKRLQSILQKKGYKVYMTRTDDTYVSLEDRTIFTEGINPAVFVSVHVNSCNSDTPNGIETHYYHEDSIELADCVHKNLIKHINTTNRGLFKSRFYVINHTTVPAILVEIGFISNTAERQALTTPQRQQATAEGIAEGIIEYLKTVK